MLHLINSPCYVLEEALLLRNLQMLQKIQEASGAKILCTLKGFAMHEVFGLIDAHLSGATVSSLHECLLAKEGFKGEIHAYSPAYLPEEFGQIADACTHITFNSLSQWNFFKNQISSKRQKINCGLRINPEYSEVSVGLYDPATKGSRLGIAIESLGKQLPEGIEGLHFHVLCENHADVLERVLAVVETKCSHLLHQAKWLNIGGGHWITGKGYDTNLLISLIKKMKEKYHLEIILEPGSAIAWQAGFLLSKILDIVINAGVQTAILDVSFAAHMPDCLEMPYQPEIGGASTASGRYEYTMGGLTCLAADAIGSYYFNRPLKVGDNIVFQDMMHYTMVKNTVFNGVNLPSIGILTQQGEFKCLRRFGYEHYREKL